MFKTLVKLLLVCSMCVVALTACEQQKQASAEAGTIPKTIIDKASNDINAAQALAAKKMQAFESIDATAIDAPADEQQ